MSPFNKINQHPAAAWVCYILCVVIFAIMSAIILLLLRIDAVWPQRIASAVGGSIGGFIWKGLAGWPWQIPTTTSAH